MNTFKSSVVRAKYLIALAIVAFLSATGFLYLTWTLSEQAKYGPLINISGRQRMLSQRIIQHVLRLKLNPNDKIIKSKLIEDTNLFELSHREIISGQWVEGKQYELSKKSIKIYRSNNGVNNKVEDFLVKIKKIISGENLKIDIDETDSLLNALNYAVQNFEEESTSLTKKLKKLEFIVFLTTLTTLLLELILIFNPLNRKLNKIFNELTKSRNEAEKANEIKSKFISNVTHELRTPLNGVVAASELLKQMKIDSQAKQLITIIQNSSNMTLRLINDVLDFSSVESGNAIYNPQWINLNNFLVKLKMQFELLAREKGIEFIFKNELSTYEAYADELKLNQLLSNILSNAIKFTKVGRVIFSVTKVEEKILFRIEDTGPGIPTNFRDEIYDSFSRVYDNSREYIQGTGLGLNISKKIIEEMNGKIELDSEVDKGSVFSVLIPLKLKKVTEKKITTIIKQEGSYNFNILLLEDNKVNQKVIVLQLEKLGCTVDLCENGEEGLEKIPLNTYDVILSDIQMPVMDGLQFIKECKKRDVKIPIVAVTANSNKDDVRKYSEYGFFSTLGKPITIKSIRELFEKISENQRLDKVS